MNRTTTLDALLANPDALPEAVVDCLWEDCDATLADVLLAFAGEAPAYTGGLSQAVLVEWCRATEPEHEYHVRMADGHVRSRRWQVVRDVWPRWSLPRPAAQMTMIQEIVLTHDGPAHASVGIRLQPGDVPVAPTSLAPKVQTHLVGPGLIILPEGGSFAVEALRECGRFWGRFVGVLVPLGAGGAAGLPPTIILPIDSACPESVRDLKRRVLGLFPEIEVPCPVCVAGRQPADPFDPCPLCGCQDVDAFGMVLAPDLIPPEPVFRQIVPQPDIPTTAGTLG